MTQPFNIKKAIETLRDLIRDIQKYSDQINQLRLYHIVALAQLRDAECAAREEYFTGKTKVKATELSKWMDWKTDKESRAEEELSNEIKRIQGLLDTSKETINATKMAARLAGIELSNYNLPL